MLQAKPEYLPMTNANGNPVDNNQNTMTAGPRGPILLQDINYIEKIAHFDRERVPERVVHAKGVGAHGVFEVTNDITKYCKAKIFEKVGKKTPMFARMSTVIGERGSPDTRRDPRGFALKFYTEEGNWDLVGNNIPVFFINDPSKFPDLIHSFKRNPQTNQTDQNTFWDFLSNTPEAVHCVTMIFSDRGTPNGLRHMHGFGNHTFRLVNANDDIVFVKFHYMSNQGIKNLTNEEAVRLEGESPEYNTADLFDAIESGNFPSWTLSIQVMTEEQAMSGKWDIFDVTKIWPKGDFPLIEIGKFTLNKNVENFHAEVEQVAFAPANLVPGIEPSTDKLLQGRLFSYPDTQRYRIGTNYQQLPINCPYQSIKVANDQRDGTMAINNQGNRLNYDPCSWGNYRENPKYHISQYELNGLIGKYSYNIGSDHYSQPRVLFEKVMKEGDRANLLHNIAGKLKLASKDIQLRMCKIFYRVHPDYGKGVATLLGLPHDKLGELEEVRDNIEAKVTYKNKNPKATHETLDGITTAGEKNPK